MSSIPEDVRLKARTLLLKAKIYRFAAIVFAVVGVGVLATLSLRNGEEEGLADTLINPVTVALLIVLFLPAAVLSWQAERLRKRIHTMVKDAKPSSTSKS